jgi:hypothetical protein
MIYYDFLETLKNNLKSVRIIKDHVSFDLNFPNKWIIPNEYKEVQEVSILNGNDGTYSFVSKLDKGSIDTLETTINDIITFNIDREEKENLFRNKVQELKSIFDNENINELRSLKFEFNEFNVIKNGEVKESVSEGSRELHEAETQK